MTNDEYTAAVLTMDEWEILAEVMENPEYLTDSYYTPLGRALRERYEQLNAERNK